MKTWVYVLILMAMPSLVLAQADESSLRNQIENKESEIQQLEKEIQVYKNQLEEQEGVSSTLKNEINRIETQIRKLNTDISLTNRRIERAELRIDELSREIINREEGISKSKKALGELMRAVNERSEQSLIEILMAKNNISDFFDEKETSDRIQASVNESLNILKIEKASLITERAVKENEENDLLSFKKDLSGKKTVQQSVNNQKSALLKGSKNEEDRYQKLLQDREEKRALIQNELESIEEQLKALIDPNSIPQKQSGILRYPVPGTPVYTQKFGLTSFAKTYGSDVYGGKGHNGVDFKAPIGSRIIASEAGVVSAVGNTDIACPGGSYGKFIVIDHPNNLTTLYAHLSSIVVKTGDNVNRSQIIGYSGNTGFVTGPHLHFTVYATDTYRLHKTKHCGLLPAGGYLNPEDYL